jgi:hypothetical protein
MKAFMQAVVREIRRYAYNAAVAKATGKAAMGDQRPWAKFEGGE